MPWSIFIRLAVAVGIALVGSSVVSDDAAARRTKTAQACYAKYDDCQRRCAGRTPHFTNCIYRTCEPQLRNCLASAVDGAPRNVGGVSNPWAPQTPPKRGQDIVAPMNPGILSSEQGLPMNGQATIGAPVAAPAAPTPSPVILR